VTAGLYHALEEKDGKCRFVFYDPFGWNRQSQSMQEPDPESRISISLQIGQVLKDANPNGMIYAWADAPSDRWMVGSPSIASPEFLRISSEGGWQSFTRKSARVLWDWLIKQEYRIIAKDQTVAPYPLMGRRSRRTMFVNPTP
jgi:hypothetical protein